MTDARRIVQLRDELPCAILRDGQQCGRPATVAFAWQMHAPTGMAMWAHLAGCWTLQPVCADCARQMMALYADEQPFPGKHEQ